MARCRSQHLIVRWCYRSLKRAVETVKPFEAKTPPHRHHPPGIRNSKSDGYAGIGTDSLRTRLRTWCASLQMFAQETHPACPAYPGGQLWLGAGRNVTALSIFAVTVKPFDQRQLHEHRHHLPGIRNSKSESYAEIGTDRLRTGLRAPRPFR
jgi:hypothetical protein